MTEPRLRSLMALAFGALTALFGALHLTGRPACSENFVRLLDLDGLIACVGVFVGFASAVPLLVTLVPGGDRRATGRVALCFVPLAVLLGLSELYLLRVDALGHPIGCWTF